jgi:hypothetical protein
VYRNEGGANDEEEWSYIDASKWKRRRSLDGEAKWRTKRKKLLGVTEFWRRRNSVKGGEANFWPGRLESTEGERGGNPCGNIEKKSSVSEDSLAEC